MAARFNGVVLAALLVVVGAAAVTPAEPNASIDVVHITFKLEKLVEYGQGIVIAGNITKLGNWIVADAPLMTVTGESSWSLQVDLTPGEWIEFKPVLVVYDTKELICWSSGSNIIYQIGTTASYGTVFMADFSCDSQEITIKQVIHT